jgi:hypothetical protein
LEDQTILSASTSPSRYVSVALQVLAALAALIVMLSILYFPALKGQMMGASAAIQGYLVVGAAFAALVVIRLGSPALSPLARWLGGQSHFGAKIFTFALVLRLLGIVLFEWTPYGDYASHEFRVWTVSLGVGYERRDLSADPHWPPGYVLICSLLYRVFGRSVLLLKSFNAVLDASAAVLVWRLAMAVLAREALSRVAAVAYAVNPLLIAIAQVTTYAPMLGCIILLIALTIRRSPLWAGFLIGVGSLVKPVLLPAPAIVALSSYVGGGRFIRAGARAVAAALAMFVVVAPWTYRNYKEFDRFLLVSANAGYVLSWGNHAGATGLMEKWTPTQGQARGAEIIDLDAKLRREALAWIVANPGEFISLIPKKLAHTFGTEAATLPNMDYPVFAPEPAFRGIVQFFYLIIASGFAIGLWRARSEISVNPEGVAALCFVLAFIAIHATFIGWSFYHQPLLGVMTAIWPAAFQHRARRLTASSPRMGGANLDPKNGSALGRLSAITASATAPGSRAWRLQGTEKPMTGLERDALRLLLADGRHSPAPAERPVSVLSSHSTTHARPSGRGRTRPLTNRD